MSIIHKDKCVLMTEYVFVTIVEKRSLVFKKKVILPFVTISVMWRNNH